MDTNKAGFAHVLLVVGVLVVAAIVGVFVLRPQSNNTSSDSNQAFISPFQLSPFVSHSQARETICEVASLSELKQVCGGDNDIDELFLFLDEAKDDENLSDYDKFLVSQLVFASLPTGKSEAPDSVLGVSAQTTSMSQEEYADLLAEDLSSVLENCPADGYENWVLNTTCSIYSWIDGEQQPIYSKTYSEVGGPCGFSDAGAAEEYRANTIINTKMKSEQNFTDATGISSQIACSFSCGSYSCSKLEDEFVNPYCSAKGSQNIYTAMPGFKDPLDIPASRRQAAAKGARIECEERSFDYVKQQDGTTGLVKARDCEILGGARGDSRWEGDELVHYETSCCSCERQIRDPYKSKYDFTDPDYTGGDLLGRLLDLARTKITDKKSQPKDVENFIFEDNFANQRYRNGSPATGVCFDESFADTMRLLLELEKPASEILSDYRSMLQTEWDNLDEWQTKPWGSSSNYIDHCIVLMEEALAS